MKPYILIIFSIIVITGTIIYLYTTQSPHLLSAEAAKELLNKNAFDVVIDVRTKTEFDLGHFPNALHIPVNILEESIEDIVPNKNTRILIYCNTGQRARFATDVLIKKGYTNVKYIAGSHLSLL